MKGRGRRGRGEREGEVCNRRGGEGGTEPQKVSIKVSPSPQRGTRWTRRASSTGPVPGNLWHIELWSYQHTSPSVSLDSVGRD